MLVEQYGDLVLPPIPHRVEMAEANAAGLDIFSYKPNGDGAKAYATVALKIAERMKAYEERK